MKHTFIYALTIGTAVTLFSCTTTKAPPQENTSLDASASVSINYPDPINIRTVGVDVSKWSNKIIIQDRNTNGKIISHVNSRLTVKDGYAHYLTLLDQLGLGAHGSDDIVQILPKRTILKIADRKTEVPTPPKFLDDQLVSMSYEEPINIKTIIKDVSKWSRVNFVLDRNTNGKVQILTAKKLTKEKAYRVFQKTLHQLGLVERKKGHAVQILPIRVVRKLEKNRQSNNRTPKSLREEVIEKRG